MREDTKDRDTHEDIAMCPTRDGVRGGMITNPRRGTGMRDTLKGTHTPTSNSSSSSRGISRVVDTMGILGINLHWK